METAIFHEGSLREWENWTLKTLRMRSPTTEEIRDIDRGRGYADSDMKMRSLALNPGVLAALSRLNLKGETNSQPYKERVAF